MGMIPSVIPFRRLIFVVVVVAATTTTMTAQAYGLHSSGFPTTGPSTTLRTAHSRRELLLLAGGTATSWLFAVPPFAANALIKGNAPPPPKSAAAKVKCTNVEDCQAAAEQREQAERELAASNAVSYQVTQGGVRYVDYETSTNSNDASTTGVVEGDQVEVFYKVLKLGKRSYDGISGEGTVIFSRGYGLEDDETKPGVKSFVTTVGNDKNIRALNEALIGMKPNGIRRFAVFPQNGWRRPGRACDGGPGGGGAGGDLRTDYVVVPTATLVAEEACFDSTKQPFPQSYAQQRRMAQRFDQSLIMEVELVKIRSGKEKTADV